MFQISVSHVLLIHSSVGSVDRLISLSLSNILTCPGQSIGYGMGTFTQLTL